MGAEDAHVTTSFMVKQSVLIHFSFKSPHNFLKWVVFSDTFVGDVPLLVGSLPPNHHDRIPAKDPKEHPPFHNCIRNNDDATGDENQLNQTQKCP